MPELLVRSKDRTKKFGEVFTPRQLVLKMLRQLPVELWQDPSKTFCDPTCGNGNFLVEVLSVKLKMGHSPEQVFSTVYGVDVMHDNVEECRERMLKRAEKLTGEKRKQEWVDIVSRNVIQGDALKDETWNHFEAL